MTEPRATLAQLNYEPPIWGLDAYLALRRAEPQFALDLGYTVRVARADGLPLDHVTLTISTDPQGAITYLEYRTGPRPWWTRAWRRMRRD